MDLRGGECNAVSLYVLCCPVNGSICFVCYVFVDCLVNQFAICLGVFAILLLKVMSCCVWLEVLYWIDHVWSSIECVCCACGTSERPDDHSICLFVFLYVGSNLLI